MTEILYLEDSYLKECEATVIRVDGKYIVLDKTIFYPTSGGQECDKGKLVRNGEEFNVVFVKKIGEDISHEVDKEGLKIGDQVKCILDWNRRYSLMKYHTAAHILSAVFHKEANALITGNQKDEDKARIDFDLENFDRDKINEYIKKANEIIKRDLEVKAYYLSKEEAFKDPNLFKLKNVLPKDLEELRIVEIGDVDKQADGGTHVKNTKEIGEIEFLKAENKGKSNRRVYFKIKD